MRISDRGAASSKFQKLYSRKKVRPFLRQARKGGHQWSAQFHLVNLVGKEVRMCECPGRLQAAIRNISRGFGIAKRSVAKTMYEIFQKAIEQQNSLLNKLRALGLIPVQCSVVRDALKLDLQLPGDGIITITDLPKAFVVG